MFQYCHYYDTDSQLLGDDVVIYASGSSPQRFDKRI